MFLLNIGVPSQSAWPPPQQTFCHSASQLISLTNAVVTIRKGNTVLYKLVFVSLICLLFYFSYAVINPFKLLLLHCFQLELKFTRNLFEGIWIQPLIIHTPTGSYLWEYEKSMIHLQLTQTQIVYLRGK